MVSRKNCIFAGLLLLTLFTNAIAFNCTEEEKEEVYKCFYEFQDNLFERYNLSRLEDYYKGYMNKIKNWEGIEEICEISTSLYKCLGPELIENCINYNDLFFHKFPSVNHLYVTNFLQIDYYCDKGYDVLKDNFDCLMKKVKLSFDISTNDTCDQRLTYIESMTRISKNRCGTKEAACFTKIYETLGLCLYQCEYCETLDKNATNYLCDDLDDILRNGSASNLFVSVIFIISLLLIF